MKNNKNLLFIGGHYNSAIATIDWLVSNTEITNEDIVWAGHKYWTKKETILSLFGLIKENETRKHSEYIAIKERGIKFKTILAGKIFRFKNLKYLPAFCYNVALIPVGFINALLILLTTRPNLIVSFGGFSAVPLVIMGRLIGIKSITHEQTIVIGLANKVIEKFVDKIYTAWPIEYYKTAKIDKYEYVGLPMNPYLLSQKFEGDSIGFDNDKPTLLFTAGKAGSVLFNRFLINNINDLSTEYNVIATIGRDKEALDNLQKVTAENELSNVKVFDYLFQKDMASAIINADIVVTRAGAHTIYELCALNKKALIIPLQYTSKDEQNKNADIASKNIPAIVIREDEPNDKQIIESIKALKNLDLNLTLDSKIEFIDNASEMLSLKILRYVS